MSNGLRCVHDQFGATTKTLPRNPSSRNTLCLNSNRRFASREPAGILFIERRLPGTNQSTRPAQLLNSISKQSENKLWCFCVLLPCRTAGHSLIEESFDENPRLS